ncbi:hypothetical protein ACE4WU_05020 [Enterococcus faecalis]|uniref:hypothetical protein n=1 Tax=Enterococcus faecalis TaxID=1351 RepID=UPI0035CBE2BD
MTDKENRSKSVKQYESDILQKIKQSKEKHVIISKYIANFSLEERRRFLGLIKRFEHVKISYCQREGMNYCCLITASLLANEAVIL